MYFDQLVVELDRAITSGELTKLAAFSSPTSGAPSGSGSQASSTAPPPPGEKSINVTSVHKAFPGQMSFRITKFQHMGQDFYVHYVNMNHSNQQLP